MKSILVINGPNLNLLGKREPDVYGKQTLEQLNDLIAKKGKTLGLKTTFFQSNIEGELINQIQEAEKKHQGVIINPGGLTHTSVSLRDAFSAISIPTIEVHLSNIYAREEFRQKSLISGVVQGVICGFGVDGYLMAIEELSRLLVKG